jgi:hypothetical protein
MLSAATAFVASAAAPANTANALMMLVHRNISSLL